MRQRKRRDARKKRRTAWQPKQKAKAAEEKKAKAASAEAGGAKPKRTKEELDALKAAGCSQSRGPQSRAAVAA